MRIHPPQELLGYISFENGTVIEMKAITQELRPLLDDFKNQCKLEKERKCKMREELLKSISNK